MLRFNDALKMLLAKAPSPPGTESLALQQDRIVHLKGRILAGDLTAGCHRPDRDRSRMDGYAVKAADLSPGCRLPVDGTVRPGDQPLPLVAGRAQKIFTGAALPEGADTILPLEEVRTDTADGAESIVPVSQKPGDWIRRRGEDFRAGDTLLQAGSVLTARSLMLAAAAGWQEIVVRKPLRTGFLRLGSELASAGEAIPAGRETDLNGLLLACGLNDSALQTRDLGIVADNRELLTGRLQEATEHCDLILTCGGASAGEEDFIRPVLRQLGELYFERVAMRPGMPFAAGRIGDSRILCLPGNPLSVFATFHLLARPLIRRMQGANTTQEPAPLLAKSRNELHNDSECMLLLQARYEQTGGDIGVTAAEFQHSALLGPLADANCALELMPKTRIARGDYVRVWPYTPF